MNIRAIALAWLSATFVAGIVTAESPQIGSPPGRNVKPQPRSLSAIRADVSAALRTEALSRRAGTNKPDVLRLIDLYREMAGHPQRDTSNSLQEMGLQVRSRLETVRDRIKSQIKRSATKQKNPVAASPKSRVLAQQIPQPGAAGIGQGVVVAGTQSVAATTTDFGPELVELIEATISPATWRINGGKGAIVYFAPLHVLVVSAPDDVHAQVGDLLRQLQAAQRQHDGVQVVTDVELGRARN